MQDRSPPTRQIFLLRTAGPYIWVKSRHRSMSAGRPLYPQKRTLELTRGMSALCQKQTWRLEPENCFKKLLDGRFRCLGSFRIVTYMWI